MLLAQKDVLAIEKLGYKKDQFCFVDKEGFIKLQNMNHKCFFLDAGKCKIYHYRPQGCRFYPLIFDLDYNKVIIDDDCPLAKTIVRTSIAKYEKDLREFIKILLKEKDMRK